MGKKTNIIISVFVSVMMAILCITLLIITMNQCNSTAPLSSTNSDTSFLDEAIVSEEIPAQNTSEPLVSFDSQLTPSSKLSTIRSSSNQPSSSTTSQKQEITKPERVEKEESEPVAIVEKESVGADPNPIQTSEERRRKHEVEQKRRANKYFEENGIDPATAGETGEVCPWCGKKIWDSSKYGVISENGALYLIPGDPENWETSGYCRGTCGIILR